MSFVEYIKAVLFPTKEHIQQYAFFRKHFWWRVFPKISYPRPNYANEKLAEDLPERLQWIRRRHFLLFGDNWLDHDDNRPIAVLWSLSPWKRDVISDFLPEYRVAIPRQKYPFLLGLYACWRIRREGIVFVTWSHKEPTRAKLMARLLGIGGFLRMEDGFIRSANLGAAHTLPESLVLDRSGLYFDANSPSDLENILNSYDFGSHDNQKLMENAKNIMKIIKDLGTTKYNLRTYETASSLLGMRLKRRVLVIGQIESDASIVYGKAEGWSNYLLLRLAIDENPDAEIIYRPHPDVAKGLTRFTRRIRSKHLPANVTILDKVEISLRDIFEQVNHVYTITSLAGFEALLHGIKVTVVGAPFYAGWGLTDDRQTHPRRTRRLSLQEVFCAAYLLYPRYRANATNADKTVGLLGAIFSVTGAAEAALAKRLTNDIDRQEIAPLFASKNWPILLAEQNKTQLSEPEFRKAVQSIGGYHLVSRAGRSARVMLAYILAGLIENERNLDVVLKSIKPLMPLDDYGALISDLWHVKPSQMLAEHWTWYATKISDTDHIPPLLNDLSREEIETERNPEIINPGLQLSLAIHHLENRNLHEAENILKKLALLGIFIKEILWRSAEIMRLRFDFASSWFLLTILTRIDFNWRGGAAFAQLLTSSNIVGNSAGAISSVAVLSQLNSERLGAVQAVESDMAEDYGVLPLVEAFITAENSVSHGSQSLRKARALILSDRHAEAEALLRKSYGRQVNRGRFVFLLSQALSFQAKLSEAKSLLTQHLDETPSPQIFAEALRISIIMGDYLWAADLLKQAEAMDIEVPDVNRRKVLLGLGRIQESYLGFRDTKASQLLKKYIPDQYIQSADLINESRKDNVVVVASFGPGDEIRFAGMYGAMAAAIGAHQVQFTCDPRLQPLLKRSMPDLSFVPTTRLRGISRRTNLDDYSRLPGSDLHIFADNAGWKHIESASAVILTTDLLGDVITDYASFTGLPYIKPDPEKVVQYRERWKMTKGPRVGISWRSSLTTYSRNEHYLDIEQLMPIFGIEGIQFFNLQYDDCRDELAKVNALHPGKLIDLEGVDQYNDFESVAAHMCSMDLIIAPATTVVELAGALGRPTWLLSNSSELHWRKRPADGLDVWHNSITHIEGKILGSKESLAESLKTALECWRDNFYAASKRAA